MNSNGSDVPEIVRQAGRAFGSDARKAIIRAIASHGGSGVVFGVVFEQVGGTRSAVARHVQELENLGVVRCDVPRGERVGRAGRYTIDADRVAELLTALKDWMLKE